MLTPLDIDNKTFKKTKIGGYDINEVEEFLVMVMEDYEKLYKENAELREKVTKSQENISYYKSVEEGIKQTIENAQETAENIKQVALHDAENIRAQAELEAKNNLEDLKLEIKKKEVELEDKRKQMQIYKIRVSSMLEAQLKILNEDRDI